MRALLLTRRSFGLRSNVESITIPATGFVDNLPFLRPVERETILVRKERLNSAIVLKEGLKLKKQQKFKLRRLSLP